MRFLFFFVLAVATVALANVPDLAITPGLAPAGAPWWAQYAILAAPALCLWLFSQGVDALNAVVKKRDADGVATGPRVRFLLAILNVMAGNMLKGKRVVGVEAAEPEVKP